MDNIKKLTLTIGIPALNEQANIQKVLKTLLSQKDDNFELIEIIVNSDGSTDNTVEYAKAINDKRIKVLDNKDRIGKIKRVNQMFEMGKGDVIAIIDADVTPKSDWTFNELLKPFVDDSRTVYVSGTLIPTAPKTFMEQAVIASRSVWDQIRLHLKNGHSVYTCHGALYALKNSFAKNAKFPESIWADIGFHYFLCLQKNYKYSPAPKAAVYFRTPATARDYLRQIERYQREDKALINYFGESITKEYFIPKEMLYKYKALAFAKYPIHCTAIFLINFYAKHLRGKNVKNAAAGWTMITSTKEEISND